MIVVDFQTVAKPETSPENLDTKLRKLHSSMALGRIQRAEIRPPVLFRRRLLLVFHLCIRNVILHVKEIVWHEISENTN
jgi:hypothetical protein